MSVAPGPKPAATARTVARSWFVTSHEPSDETPQTRAATSSNGRAARATASWPRNERAPLGSSSVTSVSTSTSSEPVRTRVRSAASRSTSSSARTETRWPASLVRWFRVSSPRLT